MQQCWQAWAWLGQLHLRGALAMGQRDKHVKLSESQLTHLYVGIRLKPVS